MAKSQIDNNMSANLGLVFAAGLLAGYVANLLLPDKTKEQLGESARKLKDTVMDEENMEKVKSLLPSKSADVIELYMDTRTQIMNELEEMKVSWESLNKKKYSELVKKALDSLITDRKIPEDQIQALQKYLDNDYKTFRSNTEKKA